MQLLKSLLNVIEKHLKGNKKGKNEKILLDWER